MDYKLNLGKMKILWIIPALLMCLTSFGQSSMEVAFENSMVKTVNDADLQWGPCPPFMPEGCNIAVLHGDPAKKNADILFKVKGNSEIPNHWHNSPERMILLEGEMQVTYSKESTQRLKAGAYAYGPSKKPHTAKCISKKPCVLFIAFEEPVDAFAIEVK